MNVYRLFKKCGHGENSLLWDALGWCRNRAGRKSQNVREMRAEVSENFGFFGTSIPSGRMGLSVGLLFDDEDAFLRFGGQRVALVYREWEDGMTFEEQHAAVTVEEHPRFIQIMGLASIDDFGVSDDEKGAILQFISWNWHLIRVLGLTTAPNKAGFVDATDFAFRRIMKPNYMDFAGISAHCTSEDGTGFLASVGIHDFGKSLGEWHTADFAIPHAYIWTKDGNLATRIRLDREEPPESASDLCGLFATDVPLAGYAEKVLAWCKEPPRSHYGERTNWEAMRASFRDEMAMRKTENQNEAEG